MLFEELLARIRKMAEGQDATAKLHVQETVILNKMINELMWEIAELKATIRNRDEEIILLNQRNRIMANMLTKELLRS